MSTRLAFVALLAACTDLPEAMSFDHSSGTGSDLRDCVCAYHDGTDGDYLLQFSCTTGNDTIESISFFADPRNTNGEGAGQMIYIPTSEPANYAGGSVAVIDPIGPPHDPAALKVIRDVSNISFRWDEQDDCNVAQPCEIDSFHLLAGEVSGGHGGCEDYYASQMNLLK